METPWVTGHVLKPLRRLGKVEGDFTPVEGFTRSSAYPYIFFVDCLSSDISILSAKPTTCNLFTPEGEHEGHTELNYVLSTIFLGKSDNKNVFRNTCLMTWKNMACDKKQSSIR